jgi:hypothetical protein
MSLQDGMSVEDIGTTGGPDAAGGARFERSGGAVSSSSARASQTSSTATTAAVKEPGAVQALLTREFAALKPGEAAKVGGKVDVAAELAVGAETTLEVARRKDGKYEVKVGGELFVGGGAQNHETHTEFRAGVTAGAGVTFVVDTPEAAAKLATDVAVGAAKGAALSTVFPFLPGGAAAGVASVAVDHAKDVAEVAVSGGGAMEFEKKLGIDQSLAAKFGVGAALEGGLVFAPPDQVFFEGKAKVALAAEAETELGHEAGLGLGGGEVEGTITVRAPVGRVKNADDLQDPAVRARLLADLKPEQAKTTMSFEGEVKGGGLPGDVTVKVEKEIEGNRLDELFAPGHWETEVEMNIGPRISVGIGPATAEIGVQRSVILEGHTSEGSLADVVAEVEARSDQIAAEAKAKRPADGNALRTGLR